MIEIKGELVNSKINPKKISRIQNKKTWET